MVPQLLSLTIAICQASETGTPDTDPPIVSEIVTSELTSSSATITWSTNELSDSAVVYGSTSSLGSTTADLSLVTAHSMNLTELSEATTYYYEVHSTDASGNTAINNNGGAYYTFTTLPPDTTPPTASLDVSMSREENSRGGSIWSRASATVIVLVDGIPLKAATVYGSWSGAYDEPVTGTTTGKGEITFRTPWVKQAGTYTFTVVGVQKDGIEYVLTGETKLSI